MSKKKVGKKRWSFNSIPIKKRGNANIRIMPKPRDMRYLIERAKEIEEELSGVRPLYNEMDQIVNQILDHCKNGMDLSSYGVNLIDQFENKGTCFKTVAFSRWKLEWNFKKAS